MSIGRLADRRWDVRSVVLQRVAALAGRGSTLFLGVAAVAVWAAIYHETLLSLVRRWNSDPNYSHGYLVPLVSAYLAWQSWEAAGGRRRIPLRGGTVAGASLLCFAMVLASATALVPSLVGESASMLLALAGIALLVGGWAWWRHLWAPIAFLVFLVPWPSELYSRAAFPLQLLVSRMSAVLLEIAGVPVLRDGNLIHLPGQTMHVAQACSGMRQLTAFLAITACAALLVRRPLWYRLALLVSSIPIAVLVNGLRVTATGLIIHHVGVEWTQGMLHTAEGLIMILLGLAVLGLEVQLLDWTLDRPDRGPSAPTFGGRPH
jgi:exosortase